MKTGPKPTPIMDRFLAKASPEPMSGCWIWTGGVSACGYGRINKGGHHSNMLPAHRVAWMIFRGPIPPGMEVAHKCDVRCCVNPDHLWLASHPDNMTDLKNKGRWGNHLRKAVRP